VGELLPDGRPRFRRMLILVARQNGKTYLLCVLTLYWLFVECQPLTVGTSTNLDYAREAWELAVTAIEDIEPLSRLMPKNGGGIRRTNGEQQIKTAERCRYKIAASNRKGGRSLTIDRLVCDELREHANWDAYNAAYNAMNAVSTAQAFFISNAGSDESVVLNSLLKSAREFIDTGLGDPRLGLAEWSAPDGCALDDPHALAQANPQAGRRVEWDTLLGPARSAMLSGGDEEAGFRTEVLCQRVRKLDPAVDISRWQACGPRPDRPAQSLAPLRAHLAFGIDVSPDGLHVTCYAAAVDSEGLVHVDPVRAWTGPLATKELLADLPDLARTIRPRAVGWIPGGPAAAVAARLADRKQRSPWPPPGVKVSAIGAEATAVCMGLSEQVRTGVLRHPADPLLDAQIESAGKGRRGDAWVFIRPRDGWVDAVYACAIAVHLARTFPVPLTANRVVSVPR
jgi:hypothetical protein